MKGEVMIRILECLERTARNVGSLFEVFLADRATSYRRLRKLSFSHGIPMTHELREHLRERHNFASLMNRLKHDGLVVETAKSKKGFFLTREGREKLADLEQRKSFPSPARYTAAPASEITIAMFDVPEKEREKRDWLRAALKHMGFKLIQRSVWIGKLKIPEEFFVDLRRVKLLPYVHVVAITKRGSIREL